MKVELVKDSNPPVAYVTSNDVVIKDGDTALQLIVDVNYQTGSNLIVIDKAAVSENFFVLSTGVAGDALQKFINYNAKIAIVGDFSGYESKPLQDFIYESNKGKDIFFVGTKEEAVQKLQGV